MKQIITSLALLSVVAAAPAQAHHSGAMFDRNKITVLKGVLMSVSYGSPHVWVSVMASPDGSAPRRWDIETVSPASLTKIGIMKDTLKPGDKVDVAINPLRDGRYGGSLVSVTTADGKVHGWTSADGKAPAENKGFTVDGPDIQEGPAPTSKLTQ